MNRKLHREGLNAKGISSSTLVIYLGHKKNTGKDTVADIMESYLTSKGYNVANISVIEPLLSLTADIFDIDKDAIEKYKNDETLTVRCKRQVVKTVGNILDIPVAVLDRGLLLRTGKGVRDNFGKTVMLEQVKSMYKSNEYDVIIINNFRLKHEYFVDGCTVNVTRDIKGVEDKSSLDKNLDEYKYDHILPNNGSLLELNVKVITLTEDILKNFRKSTTKYITNIVIDLGNIVRSEEDFKLTLDRMLMLNSDNVRFTIIVDDLIRYPVQHKRLFYSFRNINLISYIDVTRLSSLASFYNVIVVAKEDFLGFTCFETHVQLDYETTLLIQQELNKNQEQYKLN